MNSAIAAPTVALMAAYLKPTKHCGMAAGKRTLMKVRHTPAPVDRQKRVSSSLRELKARMALSTMGKKQTRKTMMTFGSNPNPSHEIKSGAKAIFGVISRQTKKGYTVRRRMDEKAIARPSG